MKALQRNLGRWLFKHRSLLPVPLLILVIVLFQPADLGSSNIWMILGAAVLVLVGEVVRILVVGYSAAGTSGRETYFRADTINTTGIYSVVRNPLYIGNLLIYNGLIVLIFKWPAFLLVNFYFFLQYQFIIGGEENFLEEKYGNEYREYRDRVNRILPSCKDYRKSRYPFNLQKVVFKETDSVFNSIVCFAGLLVYRQISLQGGISRPLPYIILFTLSLSLYLFLKLIKKINKNRYNL